MNRYCFVIELKEDCIDQYVDIHRNVWPEMLKAIKNAGAQEEILYIYKNFSIIFFICEDLDELYRELGNEDIVKKWDATVGPWIESVSPCLEKIFDLNQQLDGRLEQY